MSEDNSHTFLTLTCEFTEGHFHGIRINSDGKEESDWPPAPSRIFQALIHATLAGLPDGEITTLRHAPLQALAWLERLQAPEISVMPLPKGHRDKLQLALPLNNKAKGTNLLNNGLQLAPLRRVSVYDVCAANHALTVTYVWQVPLDEEIPMNDLEEMAARVSYFGRAEDRVTLSFQVSGNKPQPSPNQEQWILSTKGLLLGTPRHGSLDSLRKRFQLNLPPRVRPPNSSSCFKMQPYRSASTVEMQQPIFTGIIQVVDDNDDTISFDPLHANRYRARIRGVICAASKSNIKWADELYAGELISGHDASTGKPTLKPHLAIVPVPTLNRAGHADGGVRRFAIVGYAAPGEELRAESVYQTLFRNLHGLEIIHDGKPTRQYLKCLQGHANDKVWSLFTSTSSAWATVFPAAFSSKFDVPRSLQGNERHHRVTQEIGKLTRKALIRQGVPSDIAHATGVSVSASPFLRKTHRAENYSFEGKSYRTHLTLTFPCEVSGPVIIGDGRYAGMGLCFPLLA